MDAKSDDLSAQRNRRLRTCSAILFATHVSLAALSLRLLTAGMDRYLWPRWQAVFVESVAISQVVLASIWLTLGHSAVALRVAGVSLLTCLWLATLNYAGLNHEFWLMLLGLLTVFTSVSLAIAVRMLELRIERHPADDSELPVRRAFTLRQAFGWTTAVAAILTLLTLAPQFITEAARPETTSRAAVMAALCVPVTLSAFWAAMGTNRRGVAVFVWILATVSSSLAMGQYDELVRRSRWSSLDAMAYTRAYWYLTCLSSILVVSSLFLMRHFGFSVIHETRDVSQTHPSRVRSRALVATGVAVIMLVLLGLGQVQVGLTLVSILLLGFTLNQTYRCYQAQRIWPFMTCLCSLTFVGLTMFVAWRQNIPTFHTIAMTFPIVAFFQGPEFSLTLLLGGQSLGNALVVLSPCTVRRFNRPARLRYGIALALSAICTWTLLLLYPQFVAFGSFAQMQLVWSALQSITAGSILASRDPD